LKKFGLLIGLAFMVALAVGLVHKPIPIEDRLIGIQAREALPTLQGILDGEPVDVQAVLLDYADDQVLLLKAKVAFIKHPQLAREIFGLYGAEPEFQEILAAHGEAVLLPIHYYLDNEIRSVALLHYAAGTMRSVKQFAERIWPPGSGNSGAAGNGDSAGASAGDSAKGDALDMAIGLTPEQRGWYAVNFIRNEGHDFLGQFVLDPDGKVRWIQTERLLEGGNAFFASGFRNLETNYQTGQDITASDLGWAAVDGLVVAGSVKLLRLGRATAVSVESGALATRSAAYATRVGRAGSMGLRVGRYARLPAAVAAGYMLVRHPGIISDVLAGVGTMLGVPPWLAQVTGWTLILLPVFWVLSLFGRIILRPVIRLLCGSVRLLTRLERWVRRPRAAQVISERTIAGHPSGSAIPAPVPASPSYPSV